MKNVFLFYKDVLRCKGKNLTELLSELKTFWSLILIIINDNNSESQYSQQINDQCNSELVRFPDPPYVRGTWLTQSTPWVPDVSLRPSKKNVCVRITVEEISISLDNEETFTSLTERTHVLKT